MLGMMIVVAGFVHATASVAELEEAPPSMPLGLGRSGD
jgi:hypothetical protein